MNRQYISEPSYKHTKFKITSIDDNNYLVFKMWTMVCYDNYRVHLGMKCEFPLINMN